MILRITFTHYTLYHEQLENRANYFISNWYMDLLVTGLRAKACNGEASGGSSKTDPLLHTLLVRPERVP